MPPATRLHRVFGPVKQYCPRWISRPLRSLGTALLTPVFYSWQTGHFRSSFTNAAVSKSGEPLPWYTYPSIDFLKYRDYRDKTVFEFGAGQSSLWWAARAKRVVALEGDPGWLEKLERCKLPNLELHLIPVDRPSRCTQAVTELVGSHPEWRFDIVVIDGAWRAHMIGTAARLVTDSGMIICDDAEEPGVHEGFRDRAFRRVDFFGHAPGVILPRCTSIYFAPDSFAFDPATPIPVIAAER